MKKTQLTYIIFALFIVVFLIPIFIFFNFTKKENVNQNIQQQKNVPERPIIVTTPKDSDTVQSPLTVEGEARGFWYFEASFPIKIADANGTILGTAIAQAQDEWMTENFVPFKASLEFASPTTPDGVLILEKDNPSGLPEHDDLLKIPIKFSKTVAKTGCSIGGCSGQLCVEESAEEPITTCEYRAEYACFKKYSTCERQGDGKCGWTQTQELTACIEESKGVPSLQ